MARYDSLKVLPGAGRGGCAADHKKAHGVIMGASFLIAYIVIGIAQLWAGVEGMQLTVGIGGFLAIVLLLVAYAIPFVGTAAVAFLTYYGARYGWTWEWWQALAL